jgi:two-component system LytT family sensor kinase
MVTKRILHFFRSYLFLRILFNIVFLYVWVRGTLNNFNASEVEGRYTRLLAFHAVVYNILLLLTFYLNTIFFIPRFLYRKKYITFAVCMLLTVFAHTLVLVFYREYIQDLIPGVKPYDYSSYSAFTRSERKNTAGFFMFLFFNSSLFAILAFSLIFLGQHFFIVIRQNELIRQQQTEMELSVLKSQIKPHFLFNVLNSIYALSLKKSEQTPEVVMRLSEILRFMLYEAKHEYVSLDKEIQMLRDYADIEKMRLARDQVLNFRCDDRIPPYQIAPLLLIPFVENAIKHGTNSIAERAFIDIDITMNDNTLHFSCRNNFKPLPRSQDSGLGLENVRKRLQLLYPGQHNLDIKMSENIFEVLLIINLIP